MLVCLIRSIILYLLLVIVIRLMGKRQLGEMEPSEFVVAMLIADLASVPMQDLGIPLLAGVIPIITIFCIEIILSVILMENGTILYDSLRKNRLTPDELTEHLREKGITDLTTIKYAILETNGQISALLNPVDQPPTARDMNITVKPTELPITLISCGKPLKENLRLLGQSESWLMNVLQQNQCQLTDVLLLTMEPGGKFYLSRKTAHQ